MIISKEEQGSKLCELIQKSRGLLCLLSFRQSNYSKTGKPLYKLDKNLSPKYNSYSEPCTSMDLGDAITEYRSGKITLDDLWVIYHNPTIQAEISNAKESLKE